MQKRQGISLIVLVITIIIMIIIASATIITLSNTSVINKTNEAVKSSNDTVVKQIASLAWAEAYADGVRTDAELKAAVVKALEDNNLDYEDYGMIVNTNGVTIKKGWLKDGFTVVKGSQVLEIGDVVNYDAEVSTYTAGWQVLGADDNGNLLILSEKYIKEEFDLGDSSNLTKAQSDWLNGQTLLDEECKPYGYGKGTVGKARCITAEDVNEVTGFDPATAQYGKGRIYQYGNEVTYKYTGTTKLAYESSICKGSLNNTHDKGFYYYNGKEFVSITDLTMGTSGNAIVTLTNNDYYYYTSELTTISKEQNAKAYNMIFRNDDIAYWLASSYVRTHTDYVYFGIRYVINGLVNRKDLWKSNGDYTYYESDIRAVVTLSSDITFTGSSDTGWSY